MYKYSWIFDIVVSIPQETIEISSIDNRYNKVIPKKLICLFGITIDDPVLPFESDIVRDFCKFLKHKDVIFTFKNFCKVAKYLDININFIVNIFLEIIKDIYILSQISSLLRDLLDIYVFYPDLKDRIKQHVDKLARIVYQDISLNIISYMIDSEYYISKLKEINMNRKLHTPTSCKCLLNLIINNMASVNYQYRIVDKLIDLYKNNPDRKYLFGYKLSKIFLGTIINNYSEIKRFIENFVIEIDKVKVFGDEREKIKVNTIISEKKFNKLNKLIADKYHK